MLSKPKRTRLRSPSHNRSKKQESETADRVGGRKVKASGAGDEKGDVRVVGICRIENKTTKHKSFRVDTNMIDKVDNAVFGANELPAIEVELQGGTHRVYVVPVWALDSLIGSQ